LGLTIRPPFLFAPAVRAFGGIGAIAKA